MLHVSSWAFVLPRLSIQMVLTAMNQPPLVGGLKLLVHPVDLLLFGEIGTVSELRSRHRFAAERVVHRSTSAQASRALVMRSSLHFRRPFAPVWSRSSLVWKRDHAFVNLRDDGELEKRFPRGCLELEFDEGC